MNAAQDVTFTAQRRDRTGQKVNALRREGMVPANVYFSGTESVNLAFDAIAFEKLYEQVGDTGLLYLDVESEDDARPVLIEEIQLHPVSGAVLHVSFKQVDLTETIAADVPVVFVGENDVSEATVVLVRPEITVDALPTDIPESFEIDISELTKIGQSVTYRDLDFDPEKVSLQVEEEELDRPVALLQEIEEEPDEEEVSEEMESLLDDIDDASEVEGEAAAEAEEEEDAEKQA